jgi:hypothetical protein
VFYDVQTEIVEILSIVTKDQAQAWLGEKGTPEAERSPGQGEG